MVECGERKTRYEEPLFSVARRTFLVGRFAEWRAAIRLQSEAAKESVACGIERRLDAKFGKDDE